MYIVYTIKTGASNGYIKIIRGVRKGRWRRFLPQISFSLHLESLPRRLAGNWENSDVIIKEIPKYLQR